MNTYIDYFQQLKPTFIGNHLPWLRDAREKNLASFIAAGFPNRHQEDWKYTDLSFLAKQSYTWAPRSESITPDLIAPYILQIPAYRLVFIDGYLDATLSNITNLPNNITISTFNEVLLDHPEQLKSYLCNDLYLKELGKTQGGESPEHIHSCVKARNPLENNLKTSKHARLNDPSTGVMGINPPSALAYLNTAFVSDGIFIRITQHTQLSQPIHCLFLTTASENSNLLNHRNIILLEENTEVVLFEEHATVDHTDSALLTKNSFTTIALKENARLNYYKLQKEHNNTVHLAHTEVQQARDSQFISHSISLGGRLSRDDLHVSLQGMATACELNGFYALCEKQHTDHHTRIDHLHPQGTSRECYKGILKDHAKGVFNGKVVVHPQAQKTSSQQINQNLLLSDTAEVDTKPELEIYADDVQCTHGATVGQIDSDALFYLRSRGLNEIAAVSLLAHAFYNDILQRMQHAEIAEHIQKSVTQKIELLL